MNYPIEVAGLKRELPLCKLNDELQIGAFVLFGDVELTEKCAEGLCRMVPEHDVMLTAESKGIPLVYEMAKRLGENYYILARKAPKLYMQNVMAHEVKSITTANRQTLYLDGKDAEYIKGKKVLLVDDVISTGESMAALVGLVEAAGGIVCGKMAILAEGEAFHRDDIQVLGQLPLFRKDGTPILE